MKVSIIMPVYNAGEFLKDSIESILNQTYSDFEFLILNDGSTDGSEEVIKSYVDKRIKIINNEKNLGLIATLNKGLSFARGEYIVRQDADDISLPHRLKVQVEYMDENPDLLLLSSNASIINNKSEVIGESDLPEDEISLKFRMLFKCGIFHTSTIFRKKALDEYHLHYNPEYPHTEDYKLWSDLARQGKIKVMKDKLVKYRTHTESISSKNKEKQEEVAAIIVKENIKGVGVDVSAQEAFRLRGLFRTTEMNRKYLSHDLKVLLKIIKNFEEKFKNEPHYNPNELLQLLKRMRGWIAKKDLTKPDYMILYIYLNYFLFLRSPLKFFK